MSNHPLILASASPRRRELLELAGLSFMVMPAKGKETVEPAEDGHPLEPWEIVEQLSFHKAAEIADRILGGDEPDGILHRDADRCEEEGGMKSARQNSCVIIGADTIVASGGQILGKPNNYEDAARMIRLIQGEDHEVYTGVTLLRLLDGTAEQKVFHEKTSVRVYPMTDAEIEEYLMGGKKPGDTEEYDWQDKAGAYAIQGRFAKYVKEIHGDYYNVVGLPLAKLVHELADFQQ